MNQFSVAAQALEEKPHPMLFAVLPIWKARGFVFRLEHPGDGISRSLGKGERVKLLNRDHSLGNHLGNA